MPLVLGYEQHAIVYSNCLTITVVQLQPKFCDLSKLYFYCAGRYSDLLRDRRSGDRISLGARFSSPVQTGRRVHPASCTKVLGVFLGGKGTGHGVDHPTASIAVVEERVELHQGSLHQQMHPFIKHKMLKRTIKISLCLLLHVSVQLDHPQGAYAEPC